MVDDYFSGAFDASNYTGETSQRGYPDAQVRKPIITGQRKLETEAKGLKAMDSETLRNWRMNNSFPDFPDIEISAMDNNEDVVTEINSGGGSQSLLFIVWLIGLVVTRKWLKKIRLADSSYT